MKRQIKAASRYGDKFTMKLIKSKLEEVVDLVHDADDDTYQAIQGDTISHDLDSVLSLVSDAIDAVKEEY